MTIASIYSSRQEIAQIASAPLGSHTKNVYSAAIDYLRLPVDSQNIITTTTLIDEDNDKDEDDPGLRSQNTTATSIDDDNEDEDIVVQEAPILVVGLPKSGTSSLKVYLECGGYRTSHNRCPGATPVDGSDSCGVKIKDNIASGRPAMQDTGDYDAYTQIDVWEPLQHNMRSKYKDLWCWIPQIEALDELHKSNPYATWILNTRNASHWVSSLDHYASGRVRWLISKCNITGLPPAQHSNEELEAFYEQHSANIRTFVAQHPMHSLVEFDVESRDAPLRLGEHFVHVNTSCWGQNNMS